MNPFKKLRAIRDVIQQDIGNRGLARDPGDNLVNACPDDFEDACGVIAATPEPRLLIVTGFHIATASPPASETDGPLGAVYLARALSSHGCRFRILSDGTAMRAMAAAFRKLALIGTVRLESLLSDGNVYRQLDLELLQPPDESLPWEQAVANLDEKLDKSPVHWADQIIAIERVGPSQQDARCYTMRGRDISDATKPAHVLFESACSGNTIGIGDGGNEIGMGKIPWDTIRRNIPNGELIACRVPTDYLIVAGVSNWGAYALAAGVALLRGVELPAELFDPDREREILQVMVDAGPLVDGVTGKQEATVDGLSWDDYIKPLVEIGKIVRS